MGKKRPLQSAVRNQEYLIHVNDVLRDSLKARDFHIPSRDDVWAAFEAPFEYIVSWDDVERWGYVIHGDRRAFSVLTKWNKVPSIRIPGNWEFV